MKRVLFVDDEPHVLAGLRRLLRDMRREWDMQFATSGEEALRRLDGEAFDVLVTDMRMPGIDGVGLLAEARDKHPAVVRIVLSGHTEPSAAMRSVPLAHRFLSKPCDPAELKDIIVRACALEDRLQHASLRRALGRLDALPAAPRTTADLNRLLATRDVSLDAVAAVIGQDPGVSAKLLQLVNSAFFGLSRRISSPSEAVAYLGLNVVRNLTAALETFQLFDGAGDDAVGAHQAHSHDVADLAARLVAPNLASEAFGVALMHDVGYLVISRCLPAKARAIASRVEDGETRTAAEHLELGATHADIGAYLLALWGLPHTIVEAVARHHDADMAPPAAIDCVHATFLAEALIGERPGTRPWREDTPGISEAYAQSPVVAPLLAQFRSPPGAGAAAADDTVATGSAP